MCALKRWKSAVFGSIVAAGSTTMRLASTMVDSRPTEASISRPKASIAGSAQRRAAELTLERVEPTGRPLRESRNVIVLSAMSCASPYARSASSAMSSLLRSAS